VTSYKPCACPRKKHAKSLDGGRCHAKVIWNHHTGWCFDCTDECLRWWHRLFRFWPRPPTPEPHHG
jgi:hypothetical protein